MPDIVYTRPEGRRLYVSIPKHMRNSTHRTSNKWLGIHVEQQTFDAADYGNHTQILGNDSWLDNNGKLWGFLAGFPLIGTNNEQFGFFDSPQNDTDPWHGFPIIPFSASRYNISQELLERWVEEGYIEVDDIEDIIKGKRVK